MSKKVLFITWDGSQTSYMEGLFMPIFHEVMQQDPSLEFHILQFTWAGAEKTDQVKKIGESLGIVYNSIPIMKKPFAALGSLVSLFFGDKKIGSYIRQNDIDIVMPRSTFPALMVQRIRNKNFQVIFDADGLPIDERVDFAGLKKGNRQYRWMKSIERQTLLHADAVITRSQKAIEIHLQSIGEHFRNKFSVVFNGRNTKQFVLNQNFRDNARKELGIENELLWIYAGSLGHQYCWEEMLQIFDCSLRVRPSKFLVLTGNLSFASERLPERLRDYIIVKSVTFDKIPYYLNAADVAFALRKPTFSMQGVAPIKLGEYLLTGLPTIASNGIGDTDDILQNFKECFIFNHDNETKYQNTLLEHWIREIEVIDRALIRDKAISFFSLEKAAESYIKAIKNI